MSGLTDQPAVLTVEEAAKVLRVGRTAAYEAARRGEIPVVRVGRSLRVPRHALERMLGIQNDDGQGSATPAVHDIRSPQKGIQDEPT
jgi:excisionase family DNA binding protein